MGKGGGGSKEQSVTKNEIPTWLKNKSQRTASWGERLAGGSPYQTYGGQRIAGFSPDQKQAMGRTAQQASAGYQDAKRNETRGNIRDVSAGRASPYMYMNDYENTVVDNMQGDMRREADIQRNRLAGQAQRAGAWGGSGAGLAQAEFDRNYVDRMAKATGDIRHRGFDMASSLAQQTADRDLRAQLSNQNADQASYGLWNTMYGNLAHATQRQGQQGDKQQGQRQRLLDTEYADWASIQDEPEQRAQFLAGILGGSPAGGTQTTTQPESGPSSGQQALGTALSIAGTAALFMSDRRVKRDVRQIGTDAKTGLNLYAYRYLWSDKEEIGVMADEVRTQVPDAVVSGALSGLDMVDYSKLEARA